MKRKPETDPFCIMSDHFMRQVIEMARDARKITVYRDLDVDAQIECLVAGVMTGIIAICFTSVPDDEREMIMGHIRRCLPHAKNAAETFITYVKRRKQHDRAGIH